MMISSVHVWNDTRIYFKEAQALAQSGLSVQLYAVDFKPHLINEDGVSVCYLRPHSRWMRWVHWISLYKAFNKSDAANLHIQDPELLLIAKLLRIKYGKTVQITYDMHEHLPAAILTKAWIPVFLRESFSKWVSCVEKYLMRSCDNVVFAEKSYKHHYQDLQMNKVDVLNYPKVPKCVERARWNNNIELKLIYVGVLTEQRGLYEMLDVMDELVNQRHLKIRLELIGPIYSKESKLNEYINKHHLTMCVYQTGRIPYSQIWEFYKKADIGLCLLSPTPNNINSQSTKLFEYMAAGLPIIASDFQEYKELVQKNQAGQVFNPKDTKSISDYIEVLLKDSELRKKIGKNGFYAFQENYSWEREAFKLLQLYTTK